MRAQRGPFYLRRANLCRRREPRRESEAVPRNQRPTSPSGSLRLSTQRLEPVTPVFARIFGVVLLAGLSLHTSANDCGIAEPPQEQATTVLKHKYDAGAYECAVTFAKAYALQVSSIPGREGIDTRFALREAATALAAEQRHPTQWRRALVKAAAWTLNSPKPAAAPKEEIHADVRMLLTAADTFLSEEFRRVGALARQEEAVTRDNLANWIDVLLVAIELDRHLPDADRALSVSDFKMDALGETGRLRLYAPLVQLAALTRGDKTLQGIRFQLARSAYFHSSAWQETAPKEVVLARCAQLLELTGLLADVTNCGGQCVANWQWMPIMKVGVAYYRLGMKDDAGRVIQNSLGIVRRIENPEHRLGQYQFAFTELLVIKYDKAVLGPLVKEMWQLANTLNTGMGKDVRQRLPETLKRWGLSDLLE